MAGPVWVEDNSIGQALAGLADSFSGKTAIAAAQARSSIALQEEQRRKLQQELLMQQQQEQAQNEAIAAENRRQRALEPPTPGQTGWATGSGAIGTEAIPSTGLAPLRTLTPDVAQQDAAAANTFGLERDKSLAAYNLAARYTKSGEDVASYTPKLAGQATVSEFGVPTSPAERTRVQTQLKGEIPVAENKIAGNVIEVDARGNPVPGTGTMVTADGLDVRTGKKPVPTTPGGSFVKAGEAKIGEGNFGDADNKAAIFRLLQKAQSAGLQPPEEQELRYRATLAFPWASDVAKDAQGKFVLVSKQKEIPPQLLTDVLQKSDAASGAPVGGNAFTQGGAQPFQATPGVTPPAATTGAGGGQPVVSAPGVSITQLPGQVGETATQEARNVSSAVGRAKDAAQKFYNMFGYTGQKVDPATGASTPGQFVNPKTGQPDPGAIARNVPSFGSGLAAEQLGTGMVGQRVAKTLDPKAQAYNNLAYQFVEPVIRLASGAAIGPKEYAQYFQMYVPNANDGPAEAAQKLDAMQMWITAISKSSTAAGALDYMAQNAKDPLTARLAETIRVKAREANTLDVPISAADKAALPAAPAAAAPGGAAAAPAAAPTKTIGNRSFRQDPQTLKWFEVQ